MSKFEIVVSDMPEGYKPVAWRQPFLGELYLISTPKNTIIRNATGTNGESRLVVEPLWSMPDWLERLADIMKDCWLYQCSWGEWFITDRRPEGPDNIGRYKAQMESGCVVAKSIADLMGDLDFKYPTYTKALRIKK